MDDRTEERIRRIRIRTRRKRVQMEQQISICLTGFSVCMMAGVWITMREVCMKGVSTVTHGYGSVLLRDGSSSYVVTAIAAFAIGALVTVSCIRFQRRKNDGAVGEEADGAVCEGTDGTVHESSDEAAERIE